MDRPEKNHRAGNLLATTTLVHRAAAGDSAAVEVLCDRLAPYLKQWARGRLPRFARELLETDDLVQESIVRSLKHIEAFKDQEGHGFVAYVMTAVNNRIRGEIRRVNGRPVRVELDDKVEDRTASPIEAFLSREAGRAYEKALARLDPEEQELIRCRYELQMAPAALALHTGRPSADAARMAALRATRKLVKIMSEAGDAPTSNEPSRDSRARSTRRPPDSTGAGA